MSYDTDARIDGRTLAPVMIDTGDNGSLAIIRGALIPIPNGLRLTNIASAGLAGMAIEDYGRRATVAVG